MDSDRILSLALAAWLVFQGVASSWPAFSKKTIPEAVKEHGRKVSGRIVIGVIGIISIVVGLILAVSTFSSRPISIEAWESEANKLTNVTGKQFLNEEVLADGNHFQYCDFQNVTIRFDGKHPFEISDSHFTGPFRFRIANGAAFSAALAVFETMDLMCESRPDCKFPFDSIAVDPTKETDFIKTLRSAHRTAVMPSASLTPNKEASPH